MRTRLRFVVVLAIAVAVLTGCTPGAIGYTGLMLDERGDIRGVALVCRSDATSFGARGIHVENRNGWAFDETLSPGDVGTVRVGSKADVLEAMPDQATVMFFAGASGRAGATFPLDVTRAQIESLGSGELVYSRLGDEGMELETATLRQFVDLGCEAF